MRASAWTSQGVMLLFISPISTQILQANMADQEASPLAGPSGTNLRGQEKSAMMTKMTGSPSYLGNAAYKEKNAPKKVEQKRAHLRSGQKKSNQRYGSVNDSKC